MAVIVLGDFTFQLSDVQKCGVQRNSNLDINSMPLSTDTEALIFDFDGVIKNITLGGMLTDAVTTRVSGESILTITQQKNYLEELVNGNQVAVAFSSTYETSIYVWIQSITFNEQAANVNTLPFTMNLVVGAE